MTQKILGLDLGTNSIGSSVRNLDLSDDLKGQLEFFSSDIFRSSVNKESNGREYSLAAQRSAHGRSRGLNEVRRRKLWATLDLLIKYGFCPMSPESLMRWRTYDKQRGLFREYPIDDKNFNAWILLDFDGDGKIDQTTASPVASHVYNEKFDGIMQVRMSASNDTVSNISAPVKVGIKPNLPVGPGAPQVSAKIIERNGNKATIRLNWQPVDELSSRWLVNLDDTNLGYTVGEQRQLDITDVDISTSRKVTVTGIKADGYAGKPATIQVDNEMSAPNPEGPTSRPCPYKIRVGLFTIACRYQKVTFGGWSFYWMVWYIVRS